MTLKQAVASGDVLAMLKAQRRLIATSLVEAAENTRPQFNNELNKLHALIRDEEERVAALAQAKADADESAAAASDDDSFDPLDL
ncbi:hypothetical protein MYK68_14040 [Gordonia sp. PP30]|uniref:hypothetical protein n=1 Tax=Gordonia sp. PP30 TaxID=2935861 RepID=UPI001FFEA43F|nr:hypothetical protein [Gordonia sp. PP30]UQE73851.1 hypothetical protein MYK68_14040 [Gordonia sp. PP30]